MKRMMYNFGGCLGCFGFGGFVGLLLIGFLTSNTTYEEREFLLECWKVLGACFMVGFAGAMIACSSAEVDRV